MLATRIQIIELIERGFIPAEKIGDALIAVKVAPGGNRWKTFIDHLLLWLGGLALAFAVMFFIAYNWQNFGRFAKFGMVEGFIGLSIAAYCRSGEHTVSSNVALLMATISLGVLLALYGQTYQTGADPWQLFLSWALLMMPWAIIGRFPAIWIVWIVLMNTAIVLYHQTFHGLFWFMGGSETGMLWLTFIFNTLLLALWEFFAKTRRWLSERWAVRLLAAGSGVPLTGLVLHTIFLRNNGSHLSVIVWVIWLVFMYFIYRRTKLDLFMLAGSCLSGMTVTVSFLGKHLLRSGFAGNFLFLALVVIGMGAGAAFWLKMIHQECRS